MSRAVVDFFGYDTAFYYAVLYPAIFLALGAEEALPTHLVGNAFLNLDGEKFSTSRGHGVWLNDLPEPVDIDALRLLMLRSAPEFAERELVQEDIDDLVTGRLTRTIREWLGGFGSLAEALNGVAPSPGAWTDRQTAFYAFLNNSLREGCNALSLGSFSAPD